MDNPGVLKEYKNREHNRALEFEDIKDGRIKKSLDLLELNLKDGRNPEISNIDECHFVPIEHDVLVVDTIKEQLRDKPRAAESNKIGADNQSSSDKPSGVVVSARLKPSNSGVFGGKPGGGRRKPVDNDPDIIFLNQQKQIPWRSVRYKQFSPERAFENRIPLLYPYEDSDFSDAHVYGSTQKNYTNSLLTQLSTTKANHSQSQPSAPSSTEELVRSIMMKAQVIRFTKLVTCVQDRSPDPHQVTNASVLHSVQKFALLVQGWWIVKSELLYLPGTFSEHSGVPNNILVRARDYIMAVFYRGEHLTRKTISSMTKLPSLEATEILKTLTQRMDFKQRGHLNHWLFHPVDQEFVRRHPDIVQQQNAMWEARIRQLCTQLKLERLVSDGTRRKRVRSGRVYSESSSESEATEIPSLVSGLQVSGGSGSTVRHPPRRRQLSLSQSPDDNSADSSCRPGLAKRARTHSLSLPDDSRPMSPPPPLRLNPTPRSNVQLTAKNRSTSPAARKTTGSQLTSTQSSAPPDPSVKSEPMSPDGSSSTHASSSTVVEPTGPGALNPTGSASKMEEGGGDQADSSTVGTKLASGEGRSLTNSGLCQFVQDQLRGRPLVSLSGMARLYQTLSHGEEGFTAMTAVSSEASSPDKMQPPPPPGSEAERELLKGHILEVLEQVGARKLCLTWPSVPSSLPEEPLFISQLAGSECGAVCDQTQKLRDIILELIETMGSFRMGDLQEQLKKASDAVAALPRKSIVSMLKVIPPHFL